MQQYQKFFKRFQRFAKVIPFVGMFYVLANAGNTLQRKGQVLGTLEVMLDLCPLVCLIKATIEAYTGDLIPEKTCVTSNGLQTMTELV